METEEKIVYSIINTVKKGNINDDTRLNERVVRTYLATYRASLLDGFTKSGIRIPEECFQSLGELQFEYLRPRIFRRTMMAKVIRLRDNFGIIVEKYSEPLPVVSSEEFNMGMRHIFNQYHPKATFFSNNLTIYIGKKKENCDPATNLNEFVDFFEKQIIQSNGKYISAEISAVLDNPDDSPYYNWTKDSYPMPSELVDKMVNSILRVQYGIVLQIKTDNIGDADEKNEE